MLRCRFHGQDLMESDGYMQYIRDMVRGDRDDGRYSPMQFLEWRKRRFFMDQTGPMSGPPAGASREYTDEELWARSTAR